MREMDNSVIVTVQNSFPPLIANGFKRGREADKPLHAGCFFLNSFQTTIRFLAAAADSCGSNFFESEWTNLRGIEQYIDIIKRQDESIRSREPFDKIIPLFGENRDFRKSLDILTTFYALWTDEDVLSSEDFHSLDETVGEIASAVNMFYGNLLFLRDYLLVFREDGAFYASSGAAFVKLLINTSGAFDPESRIGLFNPLKNSYLALDRWFDVEGGAPLLFAGGFGETKLFERDDFSITCQRLSDKLLQPGALRKTPVPFRSSEQIIGRNYFIEKGGKDFKKLEGLFAGHSTDVAFGACAVHALVYQNEPEGENSLKKLLQLKLDSHSSDIRVWAEEIYLTKTAAKESELEGAGLYEELALLLLEKGNVLSSDKARLDVLLKLSRIYRENLKQDNESFLCLYKAVEISGFDSEMIDEAEKLAAKTGKLEEIANLFYEKALSGSYPANLGFALRSARIFSTELGKHEEASVILKWILANVEFNEAILNELLKILHKLDKVYEYCETAEKYIDRIKDADIRRETLSNLAYFFSERLEQNSKALLYIGMLLNLEPDNILHYKKYFEVAFKSGGQSKLYDEFFFITGTTLSVEVKRECLLAIAKADSSDPSKRDRLFGVYEKLLLIEPENREALLFAASYLAEAKRFGEAALLFIKLSEISGEGEKVEWLYKAASIYEDDLNDAEGALSIYRRILELKPGDAKATDRIERLLEKRQLYSELVRFLDSRAGGFDPAILLRQASILKEKLGLCDKACGLYWKVLFADPLNGEAYRSLQNIYIENEDYRNLAILYKHVEKFIDDYEERSAVLFKLGNLYLEKFGDTEQAVMFFEQALSLNPEQRESADKLANLYFGMRNFPKIPPVIEPLIKKLTTEKDLEALKSYRNMLATAAFETGDYEKAAEEFRELSRLAPDRYDYSLLLAKSIIKTGKEEEGCAILSDILKKQKSQIDPDNLQFILTTLGTRSLDSGNFAEAARYLEEACNLKATPQRDMLAMLALATEKGGDFKKACRYYSMLLDLSEDQAERYKYLMKCAEIKLEKTGETAAALELLKEAANIKRDNRATLHLLLNAAVEAREFGQAFDALIRILNIEESGIKKAQYHFTSAMLAKDNLNDEALAVEHLEQALQYNPDHEEAAAALEEILQKNENYSRLAEVYRRCYKNAQMKSDTEKIRACLLKLTDLYYNKLGNIPQAVVYYEELLALTPGDVELMKTICAIYERDPAYADKALALNMRLMQIDKNLSGHIRAIRRIFSDKGDMDAVWCASGALVALNEADEKEMEFFERLRIPALKLKKASFDEELFNNFIKSREEDLLVGELFSLIYPHLGDVIPWKTPADFGLMEANILDLSKRSHFNDIILAACRILMLPAPRIYYSENRAGFIKMPVYPAALAVGGDIVNDKRGKELRFIVGRMLTALFPCRILAGITNVRTLRAIFVASLKLVFPEFPIDPVDAEVKHFVSVFKERLPDETKKKILVLLTKYSKERKEINLLSWEKGVELTSDRVGFILANDIKIAVKMITEEKVQVGVINADRRIEELIQYSVSENYLKLRKIIF